MSDIAMLMRTDTDTRSPIVKYWGSNNYALEIFKLTYEANIMSDEPNKFEMIFNDLSEIKAASKENLKKALETSGQC